MSMLVNRNVLDGMGLSGMMGHGRMCFVEICLLVMISFFGKIGLDVMSLLGVMNRLGEMIIMLMHLGWMCSYLMHLGLRLVECLRNAFEFIQHIIIISFITSYDALMSFYDEFELVKFSFSQISCDPYR